MTGTSGLNAVNLTFMPVQFEVGTRHSLLLAERLFKHTDWFLALAAASNSVAHSLLACLNRA